MEWHKCWCWYKDWWRGAFWLSPLKCCEHNFGNIHVKPSIITAHVACTGTSDVEAEKTSHTIHLPWSNLSNFKLWTRQNWVIFNSMLRLPPAGQHTNITGIFYGIERLMPQSPRIIRGKKRPSGALTWIHTPFFFPLSGNWTFRFYGSTTWSSFHIKVMPTVSLADFTLFSCGESVSAVQKSIMPSPLIFFSWDSDQALLIVLFISSSPSE